MFLIHCVKFDRTVVIGFDNQIITDCSSTVRVIEYGNEITLHEIKHRKAITL